MLASADIYRFHFTIVRSCGPANAELRRALIFEGMHRPDPVLRVMINVDRYRHSARRRPVAGCIATISPFVSFRPVHQDASHARSLQVALTVCRVQHSRRARALERQAEYGERRAVSAPGACSTSASRAHAPAARTPLLFLDVYQPQLDCSSVCVPFDAFSVVFYDLRIGRRFHRVCFCPYYRFDHCRCCFCSVACNLSSSAKLVDHSADIFSATDVNRPTATACGAAVI